MDPGSGKGEGNEGGGRPWVSSQGPAQQVEPHLPVAIDLGPSVSGGPYAPGGASASGSPPAASGPPASGSSFASGGRVPGDAGSGASTGGDGGRKRPLAFPARIPVGIAVALAVLIAASLAVPWGGAKDAVGPDEQRQRSEEFARAGSLLAAAVPAAGVPAALAAMPLAAPDKARLQGQLDGGSTRLVYIRLWDNVAEDDDRVRIESGTYSFEVSLRHRPLQIAVPEPPSGTLNVVGTRDGGGGITIAMMSGDTPVRLPLMSAGQALGVPIAVAP